MSHRQDLHKFDDAAASIRERLQAATHSITVSNDGETFTIVCAPALEMLAPPSAEDTTPKTEE